MYVFYKAKWVLPAAGFLVGYLTNMVALKMIFAPAHPINLGCYSLQVRTHRTSCTPPEICAVVSIASIVALLCLQASCLVLRCSSSPAPGSESPPVLGVTRSPSQDRWC